MEKLELIFDGVESFKRDLKKSANTQFYFVGGCVRDLYLGRESKDIDIIIPHIDFNMLCLILNKYGTYELVGESFPVVKFMPRGYAGAEPIDVAVPRIERSVGEGHKDFEVIFNPEVTLEEDLQRRDFTFNALAMDYDGNVIDLYGGLEDINNRIIRVITNQSFVDDPLRILRAIQFSTRFDFNFDHDTLNSMMVHVDLLKTVSYERFREEFKKALTGDRSKFVFLLKLIQFNNVVELNFTKNVFLGSNSLNDLTYVEFVDVFFNGEEDVNLNRVVEVFYLTAKEKEYLFTLRSLKTNLNVSTMDIYNAARKSPLIIDSDYYMNLNHGSVIAYNITKFKSGDYPRQPKELAVNGEYLMAKGYKGAEIGQIQMFILANIFAGIITNKAPQIEYLLEK